MKKKTWGGAREGSGPKKKLKNILTTSVQLEASHVKKLKQVIEKTEECSTAQAIRWCIKNVELYDK